MRVENSCCTGWTVAGGIGVALLVTGIVALASLKSPHLQGMRNLCLKIGKGIGTSPNLLPIIVTTVGGTLTVTAVAGSSRGCRAQRETV